jgi:threonine synthase
MEMVLFTGDEFVSRVRANGSSQLTWYILKGGTFNDASASAKEYALKNSITFEQGFFNFGKREGAKLAFFEATEQIDGPIDWYVQAISSGLGAYGTYKGGKELYELGKIDQRPRLLCVQQSSCAPMVNAYRKGSTAIEDCDIVLRPQGIAHAILNGNPGAAYAYMKYAVDQSGGDFIAADDEEIRYARKLTKQTEGIDPCNSAATAVAGLIKARDSGSISADDTVLLNLTGKDQRGEDFSALQWAHKFGILLEQTGDAFTTE